jgi:hypothetical protein
MAVDWRAAHAARAARSTVTAGATVTTRATARVDVDSDHKISYIDADVAAIASISPGRSWRAGLTASSGLTVPGGVVSIPVTYTGSSGLTGLAGLAIGTGLSVNSRDTRR